MMKKNREFIATFQVAFNPEDMCDAKTLMDVYGGSWDKCIKYLFENDGVGIFNKDLEFIRVILTEGNYD